MHSGCSNPMPAWLCLDYWLPVIARFDLPCLMHSIGLQFVPQSNLFDCQGFANCLKLNHQSIDFEPVDLLNCPIVDHLPTESVPVDQSNCPLLHPTDQANLPVVVGYHLLFEPPSIGSVDPVVMLSRLVHNQNLMHWQSVHLMMYWHQPKTDPRPLHPSLNQIVLNQ